MRSTANLQGKRELENEDLGDPEMSIGWLVAVNVGKMKINIHEENAMNRSEELPISQRFSVGKMSTFDYI